MSHRRVALDVGTADPSAARDAVARALGDAVAVELHVVGPRPEGLEVPDRVHWHAATPPDPDLDPAVAVRGRADLSVRVTLELVRAGDVDAAVSASPLVALLTATRFLLRRRTGVRDPLVATVLDTAAGSVTVLDTSGRGGTTAGSLVGAATEIGDLPAGTGLLSGRHGDARAAAELSGRAGVPVREVTAAEALVGVAPVVFADGMAGALLVDTVRALAPDRVGASRILGLEDGPDLWTVGPDPTTWDEALRTAAGAA